MSVDKDSLTLNGWTILAHPLFIEQLEQLVIDVYELAQKKPNEYQKKSSTKRLAAIIKLILKVIPEDPCREEYKQGKTLGENYKHWCRAKFLQRYRLFFRYHSKKKLIVFVWVNDETCKRTYESKTDAYYVFSKMLESGYPPDRWENLVEQSLTNQSQFYTLIKDNL
ncbi:type II toxin-antitoxin system YhaV family toxin [Gloeocapsopsis dulcis]|uniref:Toxin n=1 Tax=Gloeocapsopsis dulcis AAB1 = 1H9 TaxID=1433147 RepID=A0A6N8G1V5_9CHRO|nr:type II toxin-antitoxin system YhaV family toxin [Gloeocapsopsis dulcis]MUL39079.1 toxin [Gloeocapsopsis dulcis AAB1 = 1H9]WNN92137.1 type II toxin-antitoxin system YhaV family toxin [Gloeocapsopsis dulcis]